MPSPWKASKLIKSDGVKQHNFLILFPRDTIRLNCVVNETRNEPGAGERELFYLQRIKRREPSVGASTGGVPPPWPKETAQAANKVGTTCLGSSCFSAHPSARRPVRIKGKRKHLINVLSSHPEMNISSQSTCALFCILTQRGSTADAPNSLL